MEPSLPCGECGGACCKAGGHGWSRSAVGVPYVDGRCPYLTRDNRCSIYDARPDNCRTFDCREDEGFLALMPEVKALLERAA